MHLGMSFPIIIIGTLTFFVKTLAYLESNRHTCPSSTFTKLLAKSVPYSAAEMTWLPGSWKDRGRKVRKSSIASPTETVG
jgi:hypothetical protein